VTFNAKRYLPFEVNRAQIFKKQPAHKKRENKQQRQRKTKTRTNTFCLFDRDLNIFCLILQSDTLFLSKVWRITLADALHYGKFFYDFIYTYKKYFIKTPLSLFLISHIFNTTRIPDEVCACRND